MPHSDYTDKNCLSFFRNFKTHWTLNSWLRVRSFMTLLGALLFVFWPKFFQWSRSFFCSNKRLPWKVLGQRNCSKSFITFDIVFAEHNFAPCSSIWSLWLHSEILSYAFHHKLGNATELSALLTLHDVRTPWIFDVLKFFFSQEFSDVPISTKPLQRLE